MLVLHFNCSTTPVGEKFAQWQTKEGIRIGRHCLKEEKGATEKAAEELMRVAFDDMVEKEESFIQKLDEDLST